MANREIVGLKVSWFHPQAGKPKADAGPNAKAKFNMQDLQPADDYNEGRAQFNCFAEKCRAILNGTPQVQNPDGTVVDLLKDEPENADVVVDFYEVVYDGQSYRNDDIQKTPIEVNGMDANVGLTPRFVFGPGLSGNHTLGGGLSVNGFHVQAKNALKLNG